MKKRFFFILISFLLLNGPANALSTYDEVRKSYVKSDSLLMDRNGEVLHELRTDKARRRLDWTPLENVSPALQHAVIEAEDRRFFSHSGVDYRSMAGAAIKGLTSESLRGASTITMQLTAFLDRGLQSRKERKSLWQKTRQILDAWEVEKGWSKAEILEAYLNLVTFRGELQGIAAASRGLFGKDPHGLDRSESLILASLVRSPNASLGELVKRASRLNHSVNWKIGDTDIHSKVRQLFLGPSSLRPRVALAPHLARVLLRRETTGCTVTCTLDNIVQRFALDRLTHHLISLKSQNVKDGAILVVENQTGDVMAYASYSGEPSFTRFVDGIQAKRQAGSTLKPFLYALAFERRILTPASLLDDSALDMAVLSGIYQPRDYDSQFKGLVTSRIALASSLNVPAVKTLSLVGIEPFLSKLRLLGIKGIVESGDYYGPSLALGSVDVTLWELTSAYRTLANEGAWSELLLLPGRTNPSQKKRIFSKEAIFLVSDILSDRDARSTTFGLENPLATRFWTAVKTGTSKDMRDNWCIGYSRKYTVGVWVGNFSGEPMWNVSGVTGAAPIWTEVMNLLHQKGADLRREPPGTVVRKNVDFPHGMEPSRGEWFVRGTEPDSGQQAIIQFNQRITYPPSGTVFALDPDIPREQQKIFFITQAHETGLRWTLNGVTMDAVGKIIPWAPRAGQYLLTLTDQEEKIIDSVNFEVRGPEVEHF